MTWYKLLDKSILDSQVAKWKESRAKRRDREPYVLWGGIGTRTVQGGDRKLEPRLVVLSSRAGITVEDVERFVKKGHILLEYELPKTEDLKSLDGSRTNFESGWQLALRTNPGHFNKVREVCEQVLREQNNESITQKKIVEEKDREIEELKKLLEKTEEFKKQESLQSAKEDKKERNFQTKN